MTDSTERAGHAPLVIGNLELRAEEGTVCAAGQPVWLTPREAALLEALTAAAGHVVSRDWLAQRAWGVVRRGPDDCSVEHYVSRLRAKLADAAPGWRYIHTHPGLGYRLEPARCPDASHTRHRTAR